MTLPPCEFPERDRYLAEESDGDLVGEERVRWRAHLEHCETCAEEAVDATALGAALEDLHRAARLGPGRRRTSGPTAHWRAWAATAALALVAVGSIWWWGDHPEPPPPNPPVPAPAQDLGAAAYTRAWRLVHQAEFPMALQQAQVALSHSRERATLFQTAFCLAKLGRHDEAVPLYEEAARMPERADADGGVTETWYVLAHLAQSLLAQGPGAQAEQRVEEILRTDLAGPGLDRSRNRSLLWAELVRKRAFQSGDVEGAARALAAAEAENLVYREAARADPRIGVAEDSHYVLSIRFAYAQAVLADTQATRDGARALRVLKETTASRAAPVAAAGYRADGREDEALAEILIARRGEPSDLVAATELLAQAVALRKESGNREGEATALYRLAWALSLQGRAAAALIPSAAAEEAARASGLAHVMADARLVRVGVLHAAGQVDEARSLLGDEAILGTARTDATRRVALDMLEAHLSSDAKRREDARAAIAQAGRTSRLADVRRVAARALLALEAGTPEMLGPLDLGFRP